MKTPEEMAEEYCSTKQLSHVEQLLLTSGFLTGYQAAQQWISVKERLPEIDQWCSWWDFSGAVEPCTAFLSVDDIEMWWENFTHWMPLPAAPEEDK
jgi:hypothetical protein